MIDYIIISPVRNEELYVESTIKSVLNQSAKPLEWIIVNDGSTDSTRDIVEKYTKDYPWIKLINLKDRGYYYPGTGVVNVINAGFKNISDNNWDYLVKLDCDITIEDKYFENIFSEFDKNPKLGIASGAIYLIDGDKETKEKSQHDHPWGASKIYRKKCLSEINGWKTIPGWDLADLLSAQMKGWETRCFDEYKIFHHRESGSRRNGFTSGKFLLGRFLFRYGYNFGYTVFKGIYRLPEKPVIIGGTSLIAGYLYAFITNEDKLFDKEMRRFLRKKQKSYFIYGLKHKLGISTGNKSN
jgi:glycosyltransferase involved in cell wall biosynthesis